MGLTFEVDTYMVEREGRVTVVVCDSCGKTARGPVELDQVPHAGWYRIERVAGPWERDVAYLCSRQCVSVWTIQPEAVPA